MRKIKIEAIITLSLAALVLVIGLAGMYILQNGENSSATEAIDYMQYAKIYEEDEQYQNAVSVYLKVLESDEDNEVALHGIAKAYNELQLDADAEYIYGKLYELNAATEDEILEYANAKIRLGRLDQAKEIIEEVYSEESSAGIKNLYLQMHIDAPEFNYSSGTYDEYLLLELTDVPDYANVYYTTDGDEPTVDSNMISDAVVVSAPSNHIKAKAIGYLGYESDTIELNIDITVPVEEVKLDYSRNRIIYEVGYDVFGKNYSNTITNYELAQVRSIYAVGNRVEAEHFDAELYEDSYSVYDSRNYDKGDIDTASLRYFPFLKELVIGYQRDFDMNDLKGLKYLEDLSLMNNGITDISALADCKSLRRLCLGWNEISDISVLAGMDLETLGLWNNAISDVSAVSGMNNLTYLDITNNQVSDISPVAGNENLSEFWLSGNLVKDLSVLDDCSRLMTIYYDHNPITDYGRFGKE